MIGQQPEGKLADDLGNAHEREEKRAALPAEPQGRRVRGQIQRREENPEPLQNVGHRVDPEQGAAEERPVDSRDAGLLGGRQTALQERDGRPREQGESDGDGAQRRFVPVSREQRLQHERDDGAGEPGGAAEEAVGHPAARNPVLVDHAEDGIVEDEEADAVHDALGQDKHF